MLFWADGHGVQKREQAMICFCYLTPGFNLLTRQLSLTLFFLSNLIAFSLSFHGNLTRQRTSFLVWFPCSQTITQLLDLYYFLFKPSKSLQISRETTFVYWIEISNNRMTNKRFLKVEPKCGLLFPLNSHQSLLIQMRRDRKKEKETLKKSWLIKGKNGHITKMGT